MCNGIVTNRNTQRAQHRSGRHVQGVERGRYVARKRDAHAPPVPFDDEIVSLEPDAAGKTREQRIDGRKDPSGTYVGVRVRGQRAPVDDQGDRSFRWE